MTALARWLAFLALLAVLGVGATLVRPARHQPPRLAVLLVVDQLRADYIERFRDLYHRAVGGPDDSRSPRAVQVDTLGERLKAQHSGAKVYAVSTKDRSAVLMAGKCADGAFWFEPGCGCLVTSSYYDDALPEWMDSFNATGPATPHKGRPWNRLLDDTGLYERMSRRDDFPAEHDGIETAFPHRRPTEGYESTLAHTLRAYSGVEAAFTARQLSIEGGGALETLFENAFVAGQTAHIQIHLRSHLYAGGETGAGHGSAHAYDRRVPVLFAGAGIDPGRHEAAAGPGDIAPTLAAGLAVGLPPGPGSRVLSEALRQESGWWGR